MGRAGKADGAQRTLVGSMSRNPGLLLQNLANPITAKLPSDQRGNGGDFVTKSSALQPQLQAVHP